MNQAPVADRQSSAGRWTWAG